MLGSEMQIWKDRVCLILTCKRPTVFESWMWVDGGLVVDSEGGGPPRRLTVPETRRGLSSLP